MTLRLRVCAVAAGAAVVLSACGGDEPAGEQTGAAPKPARTDVRTTGGADEERPKGTHPEDRRKSPSPEDQPGGAGDEEPARSQALFTGRKGRIAPPVVRVPPFIAIRVELRSADGRAYGLRFGTATVRAGGELGSASTTIEGLRPGKSVAGRRLDGGRGVRVVADAEPGP